MKPRGQEIVQWGEAALEQLCGPVFEQVRNKFAQWRDPRARLLRQRRRAKRATTAGTVSTGVLGAGAVTSAAADSFWAFLPAAQDITTFGLGGLAVATGIGAVGAGARYFRLKRTPLPPPGPPPAALPPQGSQAREPVQRLRDAERALHSALRQLNSAGAAELVADTQRTADSAAAELRQVAQRLTAVEAALKHAPEADKPALQEDIRRLRAELDEGVDGYGGIVAAAGRAVAASGVSEQKHLLQDAADRLAGLASGLRELRSTSQLPPTDPTRPPEQHR
ncbi:phage shock envelope stress response protein PspM [Saccharopolyspora rectivirgula]|uniref:phage shock envelope stress response protein PspM n=1 Tax=Saccharopolyspora rectivirgula TaxID=28042 RepID=UPI0004162E8C|nr:hypothetical protein [Saccharopolyspora rectivirgula]